jgi:hypothetical protein
MKHLSRFVFGTLVIVAGCTAAEQPGMGPMDTPEKGPQGLILVPVNSEMKKTGGIDAPTQAGCMWRYAQGACNQTPNQVFGDSCSSSTILLEMVPKNGNNNCAEGACCAGYVQKVYDCEEVLDCGSSTWAECVTVPDVCTLAGAGGGGAGGGGMSYPSARCECVSFVDAGTGGYGGEGGIAGTSSSSSGGGYGGYGGYAGYGGYGGYVGYGGYGGSGF